jgi:hypothetical protein
MKVESEIKEVALGDKKPLPMFLNTDEQWQASARYYFLDFFGKTARELEDADCEIKWYSFC